MTDTKSTLRNYNSLKNRVISESNIFNAIHALKSYVFDETLLSDEDLCSFHSLLDEFNYDKINSTIKKCKKTLIKILDQPNCLFTATVYFKIKKYDPNQNKVTFRPIHSAGLIDLICMAAMIQVLMFEDEETREPSDLSKKIPHNFFGNRPSKNVDRIFEKWQEKYAEYNHEIVSHSGRFRKSHEYKTEVTLDIINFFPSIPPEFIISYCFEILNERCETKEDSRILRTILEKLVYIKLTSNNIKDWSQIYYVLNNPQQIVKEKLYKDFSLKRQLWLTQGVAQGLPQSYFFGNLCMVVISDILNREQIFKGDGLFYVDDSVIYIKSELSKNNFDDRLEKANLEMKNYFKKFLPSTRVSQEDSMTKEFEKFHELLEYDIQFHTNEKSQYCHIDDTECKLHGLPATVSGMGFYMLLDEIDQNIELNKLEALDAYIDNYLSIIDGKGNLLGNPETEEEPATIIGDYKSDTTEADKKLLRRYRKLFLYNIKQLKCKQNGFISDEDIKDFTSRYSAKIPIEDWISEDDGSRFRAEGRMLVRNLPYDKALKVKREIEKIEKLISENNGGSKKFLYHGKDIEGLFASRRFIDSSYASLTFIMRFYFSDRVYTDIKSRKSLLIDFMEGIEEICNGRNSKLIPFLNPKIVGFTLRNSHEMKRHLLNAFFSYISEFDISDSLMLVKSMGKPIPYLELRILAFLRNRNFSFESFRNFVLALNTNSLENKMHIDYGLIKILNEVTRCVSKPDWIDCIIQTHRITKGLWQNGSKFLNSYTLHNEEHAVTLISKSIDLVKKINYFSLKQVDYFILFIACYLHDISMVIHPNLHEINNGSPEAQTFISEWMFRLKTAIKKYQDKNTLKAENDRKDLYKESGLFLKDLFEKIYEYFEGNIRKNHPKESSNFIMEKAKTLFPFLEPTFLSEVAKVGEGHGYDIQDIYGLRSRAKFDLISEKYIMIILRLADLHDVANDRINYHLLRQNVEHMTQISRFHWISHLVTDSIRLKPEYKVYYGVKGKNFYQYILETLKFEMTLNVKCLSPIPQNSGFRRCKGVKKIIKNEDKNDGYSYISIDIGHHICDKEKCPTICRWVMKKHEWLVKELDALSGYLNKVNKDMFKTKIKLVIKFKNELNLEQDLYDDVIDYIEKQ